MAPSPKADGKPSTVSKKYTADTMKNINEQLGGQMPPATIMQGMLLYEAYREEHCQKLFDNVFVRLANSEIRQQKDVLHMKHALEACATRHSDEATASQAGIKELMTGLRLHAHKVVVEDDGTLSGGFKGACVWVMKLLAEEACGTEEQIALIAILNACHVVEVNKQLSDRLETAEDLIGKLQQRVDDLAAQRRAPPLQASKTSQILPVQTESGEKMELMIPKGQGFVSANLKRTSSMKSVTMGNEEKVHTPEPVVWTQMSPVDAPAPSHGAEYAGHSEANGTPKPAANSATHQGDSSSANGMGSSHIMNGTPDSKPANGSTAESVHDSLALANGKSNGTSVQHTSKAASSQQAQSTSATSIAAGNTLPARFSWTAGAPDFAKPLPPPPARAAVRTGAARVTLQTPGSSIANPLEIDEEAGKAPAKPKRAPATVSLRALEASPTLTVPAATFKITARSAKANASKAGQSGVMASTSSSPEKHQTAAAATVDASMDSLSSTVPGAAWGSSGPSSSSASGPDTQGKLAAQPQAPETPVTGSWLDSEPDWAQSQAKTTVTVSSEYKPFQGTGGLTGRVPASALAQLDATSGPGNKPSSPPRIMSLAEAGIATNGDKKSAVEPFSMISGPTSKPSFGFQQNTVVLPTTSADSMAVHGPGPHTQKSESVEGSVVTEKKVSLKRSAVTIKSTTTVIVADQKALASAPQITKATSTPASPFSTSTTNGSLQPGLTDVTNRTRLDPAASAYTTSSSPSPSFKATTPKPAQVTPSTPPRMASHGGLSARAPAFSPQGVQRSGSRYASQLPAEMLGIMDAANRERFMAKLEQTMRG
ncbi:hypothetical protein LTR95_015860 [Oleoguttula sp. CCFEE 5521]